LAGIDNIVTYTNAKAPAEPAPLYSDADELLVRIETAQLEASGCHSLGRLTPMLRYELPLLAHSGSNRD
jgi:hypothetical protein